MTIEQFTAVTSAGAIVMLAVSILYQARQTRAGQFHGARTLQFELLKMGIDEPDYRQVFGPDAQEMPHSEWRSAVYINMWFIYIQMIYVTSIASDLTVRTILRNEFFSGQSGRSYWESHCVQFAQEFWTTRRLRRFVRVVELEYHAATGQRCLPPPRWFERRPW